MFEDRLDEFETGFSADEMSADWSAVSAQLQGAASSSADVNKGASKAGWWKMAAFFCGLTVVGAFFFLTNKADVAPSIAVASVNEKELVQEITNSPDAPEPHNQVALSFDNSDAREELVAQNEKNDQNLSAGNEVLSVDDNATEKEDLASIDDDDEGTDAQVQVADKSEKPELTYNKDDNTDEVAVSLTEPAEFLFSVSGAPKLEFLQAGERICVGQRIKCHRIFPDLSGVYRVLVREPRSAKAISYGRIGEAGTMNILAEKPGKYDVFVERKVKGKWKLVEERSFSFTALPRPKADFTVKKEGNNVFSFYNQSRSAVEYDWYLDKGAQTGDEDPVFAYTSPGTKTIILYASNKVCGDSAIQFVKVEEQEKIVEATNGQNILIPDGNGHLDEFVVEPEEDVKSYILQVYSLNNKKVFESQSPMVGWTGKDLNGNLCEDGKFFYVTKYVLSSNPDKIITGSGLIHLYR